MKPILTFVLIFLAFNGFCQSIHHQMISSQGESSVVSSGLIVKQTIGQLSITGSFSGSLVVQQGFQQSYWDNHLNSSNPILVSISPNPFTELIQYSISDLKNEKIAIHIFDVNGKIVYFKEHFVENQSTFAFACFSKKNQYHIRSKVHILQWFWRPWDAVRRSPGQPY